MTTETIGLFGIAGLLVLLLLRVPIAIALISVSFAGIWTILGSGPAWGVLSAVTFKFAASWTLSAIPMFLMMGYVCYHAGLTRGLFDACRAWLSRLPGGLAISSVFGCAGFSAVTGSSVACAAAMGRIAIPEMLRAKYDPGLAAGSVAAAGTLGALIPPSIILLLFGVMAEVHIGKLFLGGIGIGLLTVAVYTAIIVVRARISPHLAPSVSEMPSMSEKLEHLGQTWPILLVMLVIMGGMFSGFFTATEAGAVGAAASLLVAWLKGSLTYKVVSKSIVETLATTASLFVIAIGANLLTRFLALSGASEMLTSFVVGYQSDWIFLIIAISVVYIILGMFLEPIGAMLLTLPVVLPILSEAQIDPIWFGVYLAKLLEIGMITPPIGINVFVIKGVVGDRIDLTTIFCGVGLFLIADLIILALAVSFPGLITFFPSYL